MVKSKNNLQTGRICVAAAGILFLAVSAWFLIGKNIFRVEAADRCVYGIGILFAAVLWCLFLAFGWESFLAGIKSLLEPSRRAANIRTILFAAICLLGMYYFNSGSNHGHRVATRYILICLAAVLATYYAGKELINRRNLIWAGLCVPAFEAYALLGMVEADKRYEFGLDFIVAVLWGSLVLTFIREIREKKIREVSKGYAVLLLGFFALLVLFSNGRGWTFTVAIPFTLLYLKNLDEAQWKELLVEFCNGVLISFGMILAFSLLFRPYHKYFSPRYPLAFYSVATCSLYLTVVFLTAFIRLIAGSFAGRRIKEQIGNLIVMGTVFCYTVMTVSRTAFLAVGAGCIMAFFCMGISQYKNQCGRLLRSYLAAIVSAAVMFPVVFTITRSIPALVGHPFIMGGELWEETITSEDPMYSEKYMTIKRLYSITLEKLGSTFEKRNVEDVSIENVGLELQRAPYRVGETAALPLVLVAHGVTPETWYNESEDSASNGRVEIFIAYLQRMNLTGHDAMGVDTEEMSYPHAHNTYIQTAYDHGVPVGIYFLILGAVSLIRGILYCVRRPKDVYAALPLMMITAFAVAGLTEWTFHPSILLGFALLLVQGPLLFKLPQKKEEQV